MLIFDFYITIMSDDRLKINFLIGFIKNKGLSIKVPPVATLILNKVTDHFQKPNSFK